MPRGRCAFSWTPPECRMLAWPLQHPAERNSRREGAAMKRFARSLGLVAALLSSCAALAAAPAAAPPAEAPGDSAAYQQLLDAANAVVGVRMNALGNARRR